MALGGATRTSDPIGASPPPKDQEGQNREPLKQYLRRARQGAPPSLKEAGVRTICIPVELRDLPQDPGSEREEPPTQVRPLGPRPMTSQPRVNSDTLRRESTKIHRSRRRIDVTEGSTKIKADAMQMHQTSKRNNFDEDREFEISEQGQEDQPENNATHSRQSR
jgi:hypothetical protein